MKEHDSFRLDGHNANSPVVRLKFCAVCYSLVCIIKHEHASVHITFTPTTRSPSQYISPYRNKMCIVTKINPKNGFKPLVSPDGAMAPLRVVEGPPKPLPGAPPVHEDSDSSYEPSPSPSPEPDGRRLSSRRKTGPRPKHPHIVTQHNYHDHSTDPLKDNEQHLQSTHDKDGHKQHHHNMMAFPLKLYDMLERVEAEGRQSIVSWQTHGRCFVVHDVAQFKQLLPNYFKLSKIASFQRQLNLYGFQR